MPSNSEVNPRREDNEQVKVVTLKSGKELAAPRQPPLIGEVEKEEVIHPSQNDKVAGEQPHQKKYDEEETEAKGRPNMIEPTIPIPYKVASCLVVMMRMV